jgi:hypothetical protein
MWRMIMDRMLAPVKEEGGDALVGCDPICAEAADQLGGVRPPSRKRRYTDRRALPSKWGRSVNVRHEWPEENESADDWYELSTDLPAETREQIKRGDRITPHAARTFWTRRSVKWPYNTNWC